MREPSPIYLHVKPAMTDLVNSLKLNHTYKIYATYVTQ